MLSISTTSVVKRQEDEWRGELRARDIDENPNTPRGPLMTPNAPDRTCIMTATQKVQDQSAPGGDPRWLRAEPGQ
jgi:hypothetical protein